jgi:hypothetical protein
LAASGKDHTVTARASLRRGEEAVASGDDCCSKRRPRRLAAQGIVEPVVFFLPHVGGGDILIYANEPLFPARLPCPPFRSAHLLSRKV